MRLAESVECCMCLNFGQDDQKEIEYMKDLEAGGIIILKFM
jgi:hypothetical protein